MAKKHKGKRPKARPAAPAPAPASPAPTPATSRPPAPAPRVVALPGREPAFWFGFHVPWAKLVALRFVFFVVLALDSLHLVRRAPRYGANDFNVAQLAFLDDLGPGRVAYGAGQLIVAYLLVLAALGIATRWVLPLAAVIYSWLYFGSQLDSYQHHYLVAIVLVVASCVPWQRPAGATPVTPVRSWALRLLLVQAAIVYLWAAISKLHPAWVDGQALSLQLSGGVRALVEKTIGFAGAAIVVIGVELALAGTLWLRRTWTVAAPLGIALHVGIALTDLEIGLFAYEMLAFYILVLPDRWLVAIAETAPARAIARGLARIASAPGWMAIALALPVATGLGWLVRFEGALALALVLGLVPLAAGVGALVRGGPPSGSIGAAHVFAVLVWLVADRTTSIASDYYRFWGGSQRRLGNTETAERAYRRLVEVAPDDARGYYHLGRLVLAAGDASGVEYLREAQRLEPGQARAFVEEARWLARQGQLAAALEVARAAVAAEPGNTEARALLDSLASGKPATRTSPAGEPD